MVQSRAGEGSTVQLALRLPESLRDRVKGAAENAGRSMNSEIIHALEAAYPPPDRDIQDLLSGIVSIQAYLTEGADADDIATARDDLDLLIGDLLQFAEKLSKKKLPD